MRLLFAFIFCYLTLIANAVDNNRYYCDPDFDGIVLSRLGYRLGYDNISRQAVWVAYRLTRNKLAEPPVARSNRFHSDPEVSASADPKDYTRSGFDRGHLAPAADMSSSDEEMIESFLMTNISPQTPSVNRGIWKRLERKVRDWAIKENSIYIITGPVHPRESHLRPIGENQVAVPESFYKVILDESEPRKMIGFVIPNTATTNSFWSFAMSVDEVETLTGLDFFHGIPGERKLEATCNPKDWK